MIISRNKKKYFFMLAEFFWSLISSSCLFWVWGGVWVFEFHLKLLLLLLLFLLFCNFMFFFFRWLALLALIALLPFVFLVIVLSLVLLLAVLLVLLSCSWSICVLGSSCLAFFRESKDTVRVSLKEYLFTGSSKATFCGFWQKRVRLSGLLEGGLAALQEPTLTVLLVLPTSLLLDFRSFPLVWIP